MCLKYCFLFTNTATEYVIMIKEAFKDNAISKWFNHDKGRETSIENDPCSAYPSTSGTDKNVKKTHQAL